jgi:hypothetical protein
MSLDYAAGIRICGHSSRRCDTWSHIAVMFVFLCAPDCVAADLHLNARTRQRISAVRHQLWPVNGFLRACLHERCKRDGAWQRIRNRLHRCPTPMMIVFLSSRSGEVFGRLMTSVDAWNALESALGSAPMQSAAWFAICWLGPLSSCSISLSVWLVQSNV